MQSATETVSGSQTWKQTFTFDRYGNRRFDVANTTTLGSCATAVCNPTISTASNRFSAGQGYSYNANGDLTLDAEGKQFAYDAESRQTSFGTGGSNSNGGTYLYDGEGKRVKKITSTETTVFVYDAAGQLAAEYSTQTAQTPQVSYLTTDHLGSPRVITDQNGVVTSRKDFAAFGDETLTAQRTAGLGYTPPSVRQDYTGYQKDGESGLEYAQARYYNSSHGRFTSVDPLTASASIRNPQTFNRYSYVLNSPYKFTDPLGLAISVYGEGTAKLRSDTCSAEFSSCDGGNSSSPGEAEYEQRLENTRNVNSAIGAIGRGDQSSAAAICASNPNLECQQQQILLGDAVYEPADGRLGAGEVRTQDFSAIQAVALDQFVNVTEYYASFTLRIVERGTGENRTGYSYEISYDRKPNRNEVQGRQKVADNGVIEIGAFRAASQTTGPGQDLKPFYSRDISQTWTGTITIYGTDGAKVGTSRFEATVKTVDAAVGDHRISIVETSRTVGNRTWNRPSP